MNLQRISFWYDWQGEKGLMFYILQGDYKTAYYLHSYMYTNWIKTRIFLNPHYGYNVTCILVVFPCQAHLIFLDGLVTANLWSPLLEFSKCVFCLFHTKRKSERRKIRVSSSVPKIFGQSLLLQMLTIFKFLYLEPWGHSLIWREQELNSTVKMTSITLPPCS